MINKVNGLIQQAKIAAGILDRKVYTGPWHVQIDLTNQCNNNCIACWCNSPLLEDKAMDEETKNKSLAYDIVLKLISQIDELGVREIYFTGGGEPFMHPRILDIMRYIKKKGIFLDMSTNFTLVTENIAEQLVEMSVNHMTLSLWAATPATYVKQHTSKNENTFLQMEKMIDYIVKLKEEKQTNIPALGMYNVINIYNYFEVDKMLEFAFKHKMNDISFVPVDTVPNKTAILKLNANQRKILAEKIKAIPEQMLQLEKKYHHSITISHLDDFLRRIENEDAEDANYDTDILNSMSSCYAGWAFARVLATGDVNSCLKSFKIPVGNIYEQSFKEIWYGNKQQEFRKHTIDYDINDSYLKNMGNDRATEGQGCYKCCDNLGLNMSVHNRILNLNFGKKLLIKHAGAIAQIQRYFF